MGKIVKASFTALGTFYFDDDVSDEYIEIFIKNFGDTINTNLNNDVIVNDIDYEIEYKE